MSKRQEGPLVHVLEGVDLARVPRHVAIIMDGNGRWARLRGLPRTEGHRAGVEALRGVVSACGELGIRYLTLYAFSTENWHRPKTEVGALMGLLVSAMRTYLDELFANGVRIRVIGDMSRLPAMARTAVEEAILRTAHNDRLDVILALNYGGRQEITAAIRAIARKVAQGELREEEITEDIVAQNLYTAGIPDPDLLIRPSGEMRVSNFLLWQIAYTELWVTDVFWPDFKREHLFQAIRDFQKRERRFGRVGVCGLPAGTGTKSG